MNEDGAGWRGYNVLALAWLGDAVFELWVRERLLTGGAAAKADELHTRAVALVQAKNQAELILRLQPLLTEEEAYVYRLGRNAGGRRPQGADLLTYRRATALEVLVGYWHVTGQKTRLEEMLENMAWK
ncbi:MAG: Mini-ribonuclease 3 [Gracilibacteraceae bacterium]|nr:Mini-ribonuclease 3 [Gracilibacteraceae bacterium]